MLKRYLGLFLLAALALLLSNKPALAGDDGSILKGLKNIAILASTVPANGDVNPYGVARVPRTVGHLYEGHILVSNFNNLSNLQGTGTTIVDVAPNGTVSVFAQINASTLPGACPGGVGLTTALAVLRTGWVIVGSLPTSDGTSATALAGCLIVLNSSGNVVETFSGPLINGPWDMTALDGDEHAVLFLTNVLNGTVAANGSVVNRGTVVRINLELPKGYMPWVESMSVIGSGFSERTDPAALVLGPTGVGLSPDNGLDADSSSCRYYDDDDRVLYVADTLNNRIAAIPHALCRKDSEGTGDTVSSGGSLNGPLGLTVAPEGHILVVNGGDGYVTEITPYGGQIAKTLLDSSGSPEGAGALFGLIFEPNAGVIYVDDATNTLNILH